MFRRMVELVTEELETVGSYFAVLCLNVPGETEENHVKLVGVAVSGHHPNAVGPQLAGPCWSSFPYRRMWG
jgi:hypothetical protein